MFALAGRMAENMPMKARMVIGLVTVSRKVLA